MESPAHRLNFRDASSYFLARRFAVRDKDIVYVANHPVNEVQKFLGVIGAAFGPALTATATGVAVARP